MKIPFFSIHARAAVLFLALCGNAALYAAPNQNSTEPAVGTETVNVGDLPTPEVLRLAYFILLPGNHNYHGHRGQAMDEISAIAQSFGLDLKERGQGREEQKKSDARLVLAQRLLEPLRTRLTSEEHKPLLDHVEKALKHLTLALKFRGLEEEAQQLTPVSSGQ